MNDAQSLYLIPDSPVKIELDKELESKKLIIIRAIDDQSNAIDEMFHKMMAAINVDIKYDIAIIILQNSHKNIESKNWINKQSKQHVLVFGISPQQIGLQINHIAYKPIKLFESTILFCHSLNAIHLDISLKKLLWKVLQEAFPKR